MGTQLHADVKQIAGKHPALVISNDAFRGLLIKNLERSTNYMLNKSADLEGFPQIQARFTGIDVLPAQFKVSLSKSGDFIYAHLDPGLTATFSLHANGEPDCEFSIVHVYASNINFRLSVKAPKLLLESPDYSVKGEVIDAPFRDDALKEAGINPDIVQRVEGAMAYVMPRRMVSAALSVVNEVDLGPVFKAFEMRGDWNTYLVTDNLIIVSSGGISLLPSQGCSVKNSVMDPPKVEPVVKTGSGQYSWPVQKPSFSKGSSPVPDIRHDGFASLYAPISLWEQRFSDAYPAVTYRESDNGFIGWDLSLTVGLTYVGVKLDAARYGLVLDLGIIVNGEIFVTVDVPCVGRNDLAYVRFSVSPSSLSILLNFAISPVGKVVLESHIDRLDIGKADARMTPIGPWMAVAGGQDAVFGFILDYVLKRVVEFNIPIKMRNAILDAVNSKNIELLDLEKLVPFARYSAGFNATTFSADPDSLLVGLGSVG